MNEKGLKRLRGIITFGALSAILVHILYPSLAIDGITLTLLVIAILPWLSPLIKSIELPGGFKIELQDLQKVTERAESVGLLSPAATVKPMQAFSFQVIAQQDPILALAGLRIEIEKRLNLIAQANGLEPKLVGIGQLLRMLSQKEILSSDERSVLSDMVGLLNSAVHGVKVDPRAADWAISTGPRILNALDSRITEKKRGT